MVKQGAQKAGIDLELKSVTASVFFSSDVANPDTYGKFWCDMQMYTTTMTQPDPERFMDQYTLVGDLVQGQQVAGAQHLPLGQRRVRQDLSAPPRASSTRSSARPCSSA